MINKPSMDNLEDKVDSVYTLVVMASMRARNINDGAKCLLPDEEYDNYKPISRSLQEIAAGEINYRKNTLKAIK